MNVSVNVLDGTEVFLEVEFGDGKKDSQLISDARSSDNGVFHHFTHRYYKLDRDLLSEIDVLP